MRKLDNIGFILCKYQRDLFEYSTDHLTCSSRVFIKSFCQSQLAKYMDKDSFIMTSIDIPEAVNMLKKEKTLSSGSIKFNKKIIGWIGYLYRYWSYTRQLSTKAVYKKVNPILLAGVYEAYHSLDVEEAVRRLEETTI